MFPAHKEPVVDDDARGVLEAINDRGITHLLVPDSRGRPMAPRRETLHSARRRIRAAIAYSPDGRTARPTVAITASAAGRGVRHGDARAPPAALAGADGRARETFRRITVEQALGMLETTAQ